MSSLQFFCSRLHQIEGDIDDHVFLATDHASPSKLHEDSADVDSVVLRGFLRMPQEGGIDTRIAKRQRFTVHLNRAVLQGTDEIFGGIHQLEKIASVVPAIFVGRRDEHFQWGVAGTCAHTCQRGINADSAVLNSDDGVCDTKGQVVVGVNAALRFGLEDFVIRFEAICP